MTVLPSDSIAVRGKQMRRYHHSVKRCGKVGMEDKANLKNGRSRTFGRILFVADWLDVSVPDTFVLYPTVEVIR